MVTFDSEVTLESVALSAYRSRQAGRSLAPGSIGLGPRPDWEKTWFFTVEVMEWVSLLSYEAESRNIIGLF